jgi:hypothetical protein
MQVIPPRKLEIMYAAASIQKDPLRFAYFCNNNKKNE